MFLFFSERRRESGGLSLEELRSNMQFSPVDRNGLCFIYCVLLETLFLCNVDLIFFYYLMLLFILFYIQFLLPFSVHFLKNVLQSEE